MKFSSTRRRNLRTARFSRNHWKQKGEASKRKYVNIFAILVVTKTRLIHQLDLTSIEDINGQMADDVLRNIVRQDAETSEQQGSQGITRNRKEKHQNGSM
jgi:hypothetical protein